MLFKEYNAITVSYNEAGVSLLQNCALPVGISAVACAIAETVGSAEELELLAAIFTQLGDTLATIAVANSACDSDKK